MSARRSAAGPLRIALLLGLVVILEGATRGGLVSRHTVIPLSEMVAALWRIFAAGTFTGDFTQTLSCVAVALALSVVGGFSIGVALHAFPRLRRALDPLLATYYAVPFFVFYPVMIALFGLTQWPVIAIGFMFAVVAMVINTLNGLDRIPKVLGKVARVHRMAQWEVIVRLKLPAVAPHLFTGLKLAVAYSFIGVLASEFIMATSGIGYQISYAYNNFDNRTMYALMLFVLVLVTCLNMALYVWERRLGARRGGR